jgi:hypothetical protein
VDTVQIAAVRDDHERSPPGEPYGPNRLGDEKKPPERPIAFDGFERGSWTTAGCKVSQEGGATLQSRPR